MIQNRLLSYLILFSIGFTAFAQNNTSSTYSRFGLGVLEMKADVSTAGMGYAGVALGSTGFLNTTNAASYSALDSTRFLFNIQGKLSFANYQSNYDQQNNVDSNIESIGFGFKAGKNWGMGFSLSPYSSIGYAIMSEKYILGTTDKYPVEYTGEGGISQLSWYNGFQVFKGFSLGVNTSYLWGSTDMIETSYYPQIIGETIYNERNYHVSTLLIEYGFQYHQAIGQSQLSLGATASFSSELNTYYEHKIYNNYSSDLSFKKENTDNVFIPDNYKVGAALQTAKGWTVAADYRYGNWTKSDVTIAKGETRDTHGGSLGLQYSAPRYHRSLLKRIQYRAGVFYNQQYLTIKGQDIDEKGITAGVTLPMRDGSRINLGYEFKVAGTTNLGLIEERYNTIKIGLTFNENWFQKRKFD